MATRSEQNFARAEARRNSDHVSFLKHRGFRWLKIALLLVVISGLGYALIDVQPRHNGGSWYGYTLGTIGLLLILWLALLGVRKRRMTEKYFSLKGWTSAHVYLGLALIVIGTMHTGFQLGWNVHTLAWALMMFVILSGIYGIIVYSVLPRSLSNNRREMTREQMVEGLEALDRQLETAAQPLDRDLSDVVIGALGQDVFEAGFFARISGKYPRCATRKALRAFDGTGGDEAVEKVRSLLARRQAQLEQIRRHMRYKALLEVWLFIHIPATILLIAALTAHVISVFSYW
jgi:hypothetical protein